MNIQSKAGGAMPPLNTALHLAGDLGFHVFPLKFDGKAKKGHMSEQYSESGQPWGASSDDDHIRAAWAKFPQGQLGIACGPASGVWVVEGDKKNGVDGVQWLRDEFLKREGREPDTIMAETPSGSVHWFFTWPSCGADIRNSQSAIAPGVDVRGNGGMVAAPPSVRQDGIYKWLNPPGLFEAQDAPQWLIDAAMKPKLSDRAAPAAPANGLTIDIGMSGKTPEDYAALIANLSIDGKKHDAVRDIASSLAGQGCSERFTEGFIRHHCPEWDTNVENSIRSGFQKFRKKQTDTPDDNPAAAKLAKRITKAIREALPDLSEDPLVDQLIIQEMIEGAFWSGAKSRLLLLNETESLVQFGGQEAWKFLCRRFGHPVDVDEVLLQLEKSLNKKDGADLKLTKNSKALYGKAIKAATVDPVIDYLKYVNQRDSMEWTVDMFATSSRLELREDVARIVLTHHPLEVGAAPDVAVMKDYKAHFPELDSVIEFIVASRFALDRKKSYLWLLADSDWGKGFFMGALERMGLVVQMSIKEIEAVFEGRPAGKSPADFKRAMVLAVDEFKTVKSELKQLQSEIPLAPKHQLSSRVEVFTKLFMSAESVGALVGEHGVEDQFANRMSLIKGRGSLVQRPVYAADQGRYFRSVKGYVAREINRLVADYKSEGRAGSERRADRFLTGFVDQHGLGQHFARLSESVVEIAAEAVAYFQNQAPVFLEIDNMGGCYLINPGKRLQDYLEDRFERAEVATLRRRKPEIMAAMSADGRGVTNHRVTGRQVKAIKLNL